MLIACWDARRQSAISGGVWSWLIPKPNLFDSGYCMFQLHIPIKLKWKADSVRLAWGQLGKAQARLARHFKQDLAGFATSSSNNEGGYQGEGPRAHLASVRNFPYY